MRIHRIKLRNYAGVTESEVEFPAEGVTIIEGDNEVGKTSLAEAVYLILTYQDSSSHRLVRAVKPVGRDEGAEVEVEISTGTYRFVYLKRWHRQRQTTLDLLEPRREQLSGREAHEKVEVILRETLDQPLWDALRLQQGTALGQAGFGEVLSLGQALDLAAGGDNSGDRENDLWERIGHERDRYWTATGQVKAERTTLATTVKEARDGVEEVETRLRELENATDEWARLAHEMITLEASQEEHERNEADLARRSTAVAHLRNEVRQLTTEREAAALERDKWIDARDRRHALVDNVASRAATRDTRQAEFEAAEPARAVAAELAANTRELLEQARASFAAAEHQQRQATEDSDYRRWQIEVEQLTERRDRVIEAQLRLSTAEAVLESAGVDDDLVARIEAAHLEVAKVKAAAETGAAMVEMTALSDLNLEVDGQKITLSAGTIDQRAVTEKLNLLVPDLVQLRVRPGAEARALTARLNAARAAMAGLCEGCGVADLDAARAAAAARTDAARVQTEAAAVIRQDLRDLTLDALTEKVERLGLRIATYTAERPPEPPLPEDLDAAQDRLSATNAALAECRAELEDSEAAANRAASESQEMAVTDAGLAAQLEQDHLALAQAERSLTDARGERSDDAIETDLAAAEDKFAGAIEKLTAAKGDLAAEEPDTLDMLLQNARAAKLRGAGELRQNQDRRRELRVFLDLRGEEGLAQQLDEAKTRLEHLEREHERLEARAEAARLLYETFAARRAQAHQRYVAPFRERIEQLGRIVFGPSLEVELDDELRVARRTLDGVTVDFDQLSTGAQEQLGIISRLACATIVAKDGGAPVIFDDALGWTDPRRLERMGAAIAVAGRDCQIIVLTCTPGRYASVGSATVVQLPG